MNELPMLSLLIFLPLLGAVMTGLCGNHLLAKKIALAIKSQILLLAIHSGKGAGSTFLNHKHRAGEGQQCQSRGVRTRREYLGRDGGS